MTVTIIAILAGVFLGASRSAMEAARAARTKATITKIHTLLTERWASYETRQVDFDENAVLATNPTNPGLILAWARLNATRRIMAMEMPDRWSDVLGAEVANRLPVANGATRPNAYVPNPSLELNGIRYEYRSDIELTYPALTVSYLRRYDSIPYDRLPGDDTEKVKRIEDNQGAECLYLTIMLATGDGEARTLFSQQDIGDTDGDGAPEFLDGWGRPIHYLRWPAGFAEVGLSDLLTADAEKDHDPTDLFTLDQPPSSIGPGQNRGYRLLPLIYSGGPDGDPDLYTAKGGGLSFDPYAVLEAPVNSLNPSMGKFIAKIGTPISPSTINIDPNADGSNWLDNIHNHMIDNR